jgi:hypothetical protein
MASEDRSMYQKEIIMKYVERYINVRRKKTCLHWIRVYGKVEWEEKEELVCASDW